LSAVVVDLANAVFRVISMVDDDDDGDDDDKWRIEHGLANEHLRLGKGVVETTPVPGCEN
jgi:hypothetical protein